MHRKSFAGAAFAFAVTALLVRPGNALDMLSPKAMAAGSAESEAAKGGEAAEKPAEKPADKPPEKAAGKPPEKKPAVAEVTPVPRYVLFPPLRLKYVPKTDAPDSAVGGESVEFKRFRYSLICVVASWNRRSAALALSLGRHFVELKKRHVGVFAIFSHDTPAALDKWVESAKPPFPAAIAADPVIDALGNPKIPTCYVVNWRGETVLARADPDGAALADVVGKLLLWTDF